MSWSSPSTQVPRTPRSDGGPQSFQILRSTSENDLEDNGLEEDSDDDVRAGGDERRGDDHDDNDNAMTSRMRKEA